MKPKKPSGHENRERNKAARILELQAELARLGAKPVAPKSEDEPEDDGGDEFSQLGPPPLDNPEIALGWVRRYQLTAMHVAATKPLSDALEKRLRYVREFGATIGMTAQRSEIEELAERLESSLEGAKQAATIKAVPVAPRPPTSRGGPRGPRPVGE
jgi:hypothetical protein